MRQLLSFTPSTVLRAGNTSPNSPCTVCEQQCGVDAALTDFRCCWCQRTVHAGCRGELGEVCDLGPHRACLVPPYCVRLDMLGWKGRRHLVVRRVVPPSYRPWSPLIVVANRRSGNNDGEHVLSAFRGILNPAQVRLPSVSRVCLLSGLL